MAAAQPTGIAPPTPRRAGSNIQNFGAGKNVKAPPPSRMLLKYELASRVTYDDDKLLPNVFKIERIPSAYVDGCVAIMQTAPVAHAIRTVANLANVSKQSVEKGMYDPLIVIINAIASFNPEPTEDNPDPAQWARANRRAARTENNPLRDDSAGYQAVPNRSPDFVILEESQDFEVKLWRLCDALGEVKAHATFRPAAGQPDQPSETTVQIADASRVHLAAKPFQLFSTTFCISGATLYASMWDRGGGTYSRGYDLRNEEHWPMIVQIVLAFTRGMSSTELGQDPNVSLDQATTRQGLPDSSYPSFRLQFNGDVWTTQGRPYFNSISYIGRGTSVWRVKNSQNVERILKSAWRADTRKGESSIYKDLGEAMNGNAWPIGVVRFDQGGDVMREDDPTAALHISHLRAGAGQDDVPDDPVLHRVLLESGGRPLWEYTSKAQMVACLRDAIIGHLTMYERGYLHRDVSAGNVLLPRNKAVEGCHGFVSDVEFAKHFSTEDPSTRSRRSGRKRLKTVKATTSSNQPKWTASPMNSSIGDQGAPMPMNSSQGTIQFMAMAILAYYVGEAETCPYQDVSHDLESFIWVIIDAIMRHEIVRLESVLSKLCSGEDSSDESKDEGRPSEEESEEAGAKEILTEKHLKSEIGKLQHANETYFGQDDLLAIYTTRKLMTISKHQVNPYIPTGPFRILVDHLVDAVYDANPSTRGRNVRDSIPITYEFVLCKLDEAIMAMGSRAHKYMTPPRRLFALDTGL